MGTASLSVPGPALQRNVCKGWASLLLQCRSPSAQAWGRGLPHAPPARESCPGSPYAPLRWLAGELAFLEISFSCLSFTFICLPPLRSAACQGRVTKGWVEKERLEPNLAACGAKRRGSLGEQEGHRHSWGLRGRGSCHGGQRSPSSVCFCAVGCGWRPGRELRASPVECDCVPECTFAAAINSPPPPIAPMILHLQFFVPLINGPGD